MKSLSLAGSRASVVMMSSRTRAVAVAVRHIIGTSGNSRLKKERDLNEGRKSWPHSLMQ